MDRTCCAFITATVDSHTSAVTVEYCQHHVGHTMDIGHLRLSAELRMEIAGLLHQGVTVSKVMDNIRDRASGDIQRDHLLSRYVVCHYNFYALYYQTLGYEQRIWAQTACTTIKGHKMLYAHMRLTALWCFSPVHPSWWRCTCYNNNNNNNNNRDNVYGAVIMTKSLREFTRFI